MMVLEAAQNSTLDSSITSSSPSTIAELQKGHSIIMMNLFSARKAADARLNDLEKHKNIFIYRRYTEEEWINDKL
jgi:hypothetical protein